jgi:hypothetical protein
MNILQKRLAAQRPLSHPSSPRSHPLASDKPELCAVCRRQAIHLGYRPWQDLPMIWTCGDTICNRLLSRVYAMSEEQISAYEQRAMQAAGGRAGQWLDELGKTDLADLTVGEWDEFVWRLVSGYEAELRRQIADDAVPF